jgi:hypothetical protein
LASGLNFGDLEFDFKVSRKTIQGTVQETCELIWNVLQALEMPEPNKKMWLKISLNSINLQIFQTVWEVWTENTSECQYWI